MSAKSGPLKTLTLAVTALHCHTCTVVEETNVPNFPLSHFSKRSNPIASYCLHLSPVLSLLEVIGSPWRIFWRALTLLEMCEPGMMEAPLGTM